MNKIKETRESMGLTQTKLAEKIHISQGNLSDVENSRRPAWPKLRRRLSRILKVPQSDLFPQS